MVARIGDRLAGQAFGQDLRDLVVEPCPEGGQYRQAMLLAQPQGVLGARFAVGRGLARHPLDLIQGLEELERLQWSTAGRLPGLERIGKFPAGMRHTAEMGRAFQRAPGVIAVAHQQAAIAGQEGLRIFLAATGLVIEQHDRLRAVLAAAIGPHEGFGLRVPALLFKNLDPGFVTVDQGLRPEFLL